MSAERAAVRALTWNVHSYIGRGGVRNPDGVMAAIRSIDADIVALQEIDERLPNTGDVPDFVGLSRIFGRYSTEARTIRSDDGDYGHLLMSRWPMHDIVSLDLAVRRREPRLAISCRIDSPGGAIRVIAAHLGLSIRERRYQVGIIRGHLDTIDEAAAIVLGDFNEWHRMGAATRAFAEPFVIAAALPSFPARWPLFPLDRIWCRAPLHPVAAYTVREFGGLSDHLPVVADIGFAN